MTIEYKFGDLDLWMALGEQHVSEDKDVASEMRVKVSLQGDIAVMHFYPEDCDGVAWLLLEPTDKHGDPGREVPEEMLGARFLAKQHGILIGATDPRSLDVIIDALVELRDRLRDGPPSEECIAKGIAEETAQDIDEQILNELLENIRKTSSVDRLAEIVKTVTKEAKEEPEDATKRDEQ